MNHVAFKGTSSTRNMKERSLPFQDEKSRQALEDFKKFCSFILAYEATEEAKRGPSSNRNKRANSPSGSSGSSISTADSLNEDVKIPVKRKYTKNKSAQNEEFESDDESWSLVTCFCRKPFAGRPMIECSSCNIWIHLSCAKVRRSNIPELFICPICRDKHSNQVKTFVNGLEDNKNSFTSVKKHKTKTKRQSLSDSKSTVKNTKEQRMDEQ